MLPEPSSLTNPSRDLLHQRLDAMLNILVLLSVQHGQFGNTHTHTHTHTTFPEHFCFNVLLRKSLLMEPSAFPECPIKYIHSNQISPVVSGP